MHKGDVVVHPFTLVHGKLIARKRHYMPQAFYLLQQALPAAAEAYGILAQLEFQQFQLADPQCFGCIADA